MLADRGVRGRTGPKHEACKAPLFRSSFRWTGAALAHKECHLLGPDSPPSGLDCIQPQRFR